MWKVISGRKRNQDRSIQGIWRDWRTSSTSSLLLWEWGLQLNLRGLLQLTFFQRIRSPNPPPPPLAKTIFQLEEFRFLAVTTFEVHKIIVSFPSKRAPGMDKLHMSVIKDALPVILPVLTELINKLLLTSVFPSAWKEPVVIPILKEEDHEVANNNRPVSLLSALSKICERVALN